MADTNFGIANDDPEYVALLKQYGIADQKPTQKHLSAPMEIGKQLVGGLAVDVPKMVAGAGEWFSPKGSSAEEFFRKGKDTWGANPQGWEPDTEGRGAISSTLIKGARSMAPSAMMMGATVANPVLGGAATVGLFGGSQAQETFDKGIAKWLDYDTARNAGWKAGAIEGVGETVGDIAGAKFLSGAAKGVRALTGTAREEGVGAALRAARDPRWAGNFAKDWAANAAIQSGTEYAQNYGETAVENKYGISDENPHKQGMEGAQAALGMSVLLAPFASAGHYRAGVARKHINDTLLNPNSSVEDKMAVAQALHDHVVVPEIGEEHGAVWLDAMKDSIIQDRDSRAMAEHDALQQGAAQAYQDELDATPISRIDSRLGLTPRNLEAHEGQAIEPSDAEPTGITDTTGLLLGNDPVDLLGMRLSAASTPSATPITRNPAPVAPDADSFGLLLGGSSAAKSQQVAQKTTQANDAKTGTQQAAAPQGQVVEPATPKSKMSQNLDAAIAEHVSAGTLAADHPVVQEWNASKKQAKDATVVGKKLAEALVGAQAPVIHGVKGEAAPLKLRSKDVNLTPKQKRVYDFMVSAKQDDRLDDIIDAQGVFKFSEIGDKLGIARGSVNSFVNKIAERIAAENGVTVDQLRNALKARAAASRETESHDQDRLGLSPAEQSSVANEEDYFAGESGDQNMGIISSTGGSKGNIGGNVQPHDYVDSVEPSEKTKAHAAVEREQAIKESAIPDKVELIDILRKSVPDIQAIDIEDAAEDYNDGLLSDDELFQGLPMEAQAQAVRAYISYSDGKMSAQNYARVLGEIADAHRGQGRTSAANEERPGVEGAQAALPESREGEGQRLLQSTGERAERDSAAGEREAVESSEAEAVSGSESETGFDDQEVEFSADSIESVWNDGIAGTPLPVFNSLDAEDKAWLLGAHDADSLQERFEDVVNGLLGAKFSKSSEKGASTVDKISAVVEELGGTVGSKIKVVQSADDLTESERKAAERDAGQALSKDEWGEVQAFVVGGKVYFIADNIPEGSERAVFLHEIGSHMGLEKLLSKKQFGQLVSKLKGWAAKDDGSVESTLAKSAMERVEAAGTVSEHKDSELVAYFVEDAVKAGIDPTATKYASELQRWFRTLWAAFKSAIRRLGLNSDKFSAQDVVNMAYGAARLELNGTWHGTAADFRNFNHDYMGSGEGAQAFGWGTYLAQRPGIAKGYWKDDVRRKSNSYEVGMYNGDIINFDGDATTAKEAALRGGYGFYMGMWGNLKSAIEHQLSNTDFPRGSKARSDIVDAAVSMAKELDRRAFSQGVVDSTPEGSLMRVDHNARDDEMLDWDKPLSEQSDLVKKALGASKPGTPTATAMHALMANNSVLSYITGVDLYKQLARITKSDKAASEYLDSIGIKGIKFLDSRSRGSTQYEVDVAKHSVETARKQLEHAEQAYAEISGHYNFVKGSYTDKVAAAKVEGAKSKLERAEQRLKDVEAEAAKPKTRNHVIFNDKNIQRVATEVGADPERVKFSKSVVTGMASRVAGATGEQLANDTTHFLTKIARSMEFLNDVIDRASAVLPSAKDWYEAFQLTQSTKNTMERRAEDVASMADTMNAERYKVVNKFIGESTFSQKWGYQPSWKSEKVQIDPAMARQWGLLSKDEQAVVDAVFKHGDEFLAQRDRIFSEIGAPDLVNNSRLSGPYAPLKRFGNYVGILKSAKLVEAEARLKALDNKANREAVEALKSDPDHYVYSKFDTMGQAKRFANENAGKWHFTDAFEGAVRVDDRTTMDYQVLQKVMGALKAENVPAAVKSAMENTIREIYMSSVDEMSARQAGQKRKNRAGFDEDMIRSFLSNARANATFLANIEHGTAMNDAFYRMQQEAKDADGRRRGIDHFNTIAEHYAMNLRYESTPIQDRAVAFTSAWQLSTSLGYHLTNATQGIQVTIPWLAGQFGSYRGAWSHLMRGYGVTRDITKGVMGFNGIDFDKVKNPKLREALERAANLNLLDVGFQEDLSHFDRFRTGYGAVDTAGGWVSSAMHKLRQVAHTVETWNRVSSAVAAYNMAIEAGKGHEAAVSYVEGVLRKTQGDFTRADAPLLLKKLPKVTVQYKKYQFMMGAFYVSAFTKAFAGASAEEKAIGRRMLGYKLFHTSMAAGLLGMPMMNLASLLFSAVGGDDPEDLEAKLRRGIGDKAMSDLLLHGPLAAMGFDMSSKLGDDKVFSIAPYTQIDLSSAKGVANTVIGIAGGPTLSQVGRMASGIGYMKQGDIYKGVEKLVPKGMEDAMAAFRLANDGYTLRNGDVLVKPDDISAFATTLKAFGLPATEIRTAQWMEQNQRSITQYYSDHAKQLEQSYAKAHKEGDTERMAELRQEWKELQASKTEVRAWFNNNPKELRTQPLSNLVRYPMTVKKREAQEQRSIPTDL